MKTVATLMVLMLAAMQAYAQQWEQTSGPEGADVLSLAGNDSALLALVRPGVIYRHDPGGWTRTTELEVASLHASGNAFIALNHEGVFRSTDRGEHWEKVGPAGFLFRAATYGNDLYIAADSIIYRLSDDAATWNRVASSGRLDFFSFFVHDSTILIGRGGDSVGVFGSADSGKTWRRVGTGIPPGTAPHLFLRRGSDIYAAVNIYGIFRSSDNGETWSAVNQGLPRSGSEYPWVQSFLEVGDEVWMAGRNGLFSRADTAWKMQSISQHSSLAMALGRIYLGSSSGVMATADTGRSWSKVNAGLRAHRMSGIAPFGSAVLVSAGGSIYRSTDRGGSWTPAALIDVDRFTAGSDAMYALGDGLSGRGIFRTVDGLDWGSVGENLPHAPEWLSALAAHKDTILAGYYRVGWNGAADWRIGGIYRSVDRGVTWGLASSGLPKQGTVDLPVLELFAADGVVLAHGSGGLYRSGDGGENWSRVQFDSLAGITPLLFAASEGRIYIAKGGRAYLSTDAGITWTNISNGLPAEAFAHHLSVVRGVPYISATLGRNLGRVYRFLSGVWEDITMQFPEDASFWEFVESGDKILATTAWNSVWRGTFGPVASVLSGSGRSGAALAASPNPFLSESGVELELEKREAVRLVLVSPLGEEIATLYEGEMEAGRHHLRLDGSALPAGVYHLHLQSAGAVATTRVVKVK